MFLKKQQQVSYLIVGLGNPGADYQNTRHNAGFMAIDSIAVDCKATYWKSEGGALVAKGVYHDVSVVLAKPQSYMNLSGKPIAALCKAYGLSADQLIVIHDDMDIEPACIRIKFGGGNAGHNGLKSITSTMGTPDWLRVRVGVGRPPGKMNPADYVLEVPKKEAFEDFRAGIDRAGQAALYLLENDLQHAQQQFN